MRHPYVIRRTHISGFFGFLLLFVAFACASSDPHLVEYRTRFTHVDDLHLFHTIAVVSSLLGVLLLAFAIYSQLRFGPTMRTAAKADIWAREYRFYRWFGVVAFVAVGLLMVLLIVWRLLHGYGI